MDFCPFVAPFTNGDCRDESNNSWWRDHWGEKLGANSRCIEGTFAPSGYYPRAHGGCHEIACSVDTFTITIGSETVTCTTDGETHTLSGAISGTVTCPAFAVMCGDVAPCLNNCLGRGTCSGGQCTCDAGYWGTDCAGTCNVGCSTCTGSANTQCSGCNGIAVLDTDTGTCTCSGLYVVTTGDCIVGTGPCPLGTVNDSAGSCIVPTSVAASFTFNSGSTTNAGYQSTWTVGAGGCSPWSRGTSGLYFDPSSSHYLDANWNLNTDFTMEMWVKPTATGTGSLWNFMVNRGYQNGNLWVTSCSGLALDWGVN